MIELDEYYNFALMTFDLEGQGQGQILKRLFFLWILWILWLSLRPSLFREYIWSEWPNILHNGSPQVGAYGVSTEFRLDAPCRVGEFLNLSPLIAEK